MTNNIRSLEQTLSDNLPWHKARIKFLARFLLALYAVRTVNARCSSPAFGGRAKAESNYKRLPGFCAQVRVALCATGVELYLSGCYLGLGEYLMLVAPE